MKRRRKIQKRVTVNQRVAIVYNIEGGLAQLGYFTPQVKQVVKKWKQREWFIKQYFFEIARAALWHTDEIKLHVHSRAHWPMIWELAAACEKLRALDRKHPNYWLLRLNVNVGSQWRSKSWGQIAAEILQRGGPDFGADGICLRQAAKRLRLVAPPKIQTAARRLLSV